MILRRMALVAGLMTTFGSAHAAELITNGGFETGDFTGWQALAQAGSAGSINVEPNGGPAPVDGVPTAVNPDGGAFVALTGQDGPGAYVLAQSFTIGTAQTVTISFDLFANDYAGVIIPGPFDYTGASVEFAEADILTGTADPFSTSPADIVKTLYGPGADSDDGATNPYTHYVETASLMAGTYQIRFGEADNEGNFTLGVDNVSVMTMSTVPLPASAPMFGAALLALGAAGFVAKRKKAASVAS